MLAAGAGGLALGGLAGAAIAHDSDSDSGINPLPTPSFDALNFFEAG